MTRAPPPASCMSTATAGSLRRHGDIDRRHIGREGELARRLRRVREGEFARRTAATPCRNRTTLSPLPPLPAAESLAGGFARQPQATTSPSDAPARAATIVPPFSTPLAARAHGGHGCGFDSSAATCIRRQPRSPTYQNTAIPAHSRRPRDAVRASAHSGVRRPAAGATGASRLEGREHHARRYNSRHTVERTARRREHRSGAPGADLHGEPRLGQGSESLVKRIYGHLGLGTAR